MNFDDLCDAHEYLADAMGALAKCVPPEDPDLQDEVTGIIRLLDEAQMRLTTLSLQLRGKRMIG